MSRKIKIEFLQNVLVKDDTGTEYEEGQVETMEEASANHWLTRGKAKVYIAPTKAELAAAAAQLKAETEAAEAQEKADAEAAKAAEAQAKVEAAKANKK